MFRGLSREFSILFIAGFCVLSVESSFRRCFHCRSRGELGDCQDPFLHNETTAENLRGIELLPCASGWCAKLIEGKTFDYLTATERMCLQRPPRDEEQRCTPTLFQGRRVLMCFCKGDLCNTTAILNPAISFVLLCGFLSLIYKLQWFQEN